MSHPENDLWRHLAHPMIYAARCILYPLIRDSFFKRVRKHTCDTHDNKHLPLEYALTSRSFSRGDKVYRHVILTLLVVFQVNLVTNLASHSDNIGLVNYSDWIVFINANHLKSDSTPDLICTCIQGNWTSHSLSCCFGIFWIWQYDSKWES